MCFLDLFFAEWMGEDFGSVGALKVKRTLSFLTLTMTTTYDSKVSLQGHQTLRTPSSASFFIHAGIVSHYLDARPETMVVG